MRWVTFATLQRKINGFARACLQWIQAPQAQWSHTVETLISKRIHVDEAHAIHIVDSRLTPGEVVEVTVRTAPRAGFLRTAAAMNLDTPPEYSIGYEQVIRSQ